MAEIVENGNAPLDVIVPVLNKDTGEQLFKNPDDIDPRTDLPQNDQNVTPYAKYGGYAGEAQNIMRSAANTLTFGGYAGIADRFKTPEELRDARRREEFNPVSGFVGSALPYFIPGRGLLGALSSATRLGQNAVTGLVGKELGDTIGGTVAKLAIDGAAQGFTQGVNEASLDNELNSETVGNIAYSTLLGAGFGAATGAVFGSAVPLFNKSKEFIGSKLSRGETVTLSDEMKNASDAINKANLTQRATDQIALNKEYLAHLDESGLPQNGEFMAQLAANPKVMKVALEDGKMDLQKFHNYTERFKQIQEETVARSNGKEEDPRNFLVNTNIDDILSLEKIHNEFRNLSSKIEDNFSLSKIDETVPPDQWDKLRTTITGDGESLVNNFKNKMDNISNPEVIRAKFLQEYPAASEASLQTNVKHVMDAYSKDLVENFKGYFGKNFIKIENKENLTPKDLYNFVDKTIEGMDKAWYKFKKTRPAGAQATEADAKLYNDLKKPFYDLLTSQDAFGEIGRIRAITKQSRNSVNDAERKLKLTFKNHPEKAFDIDKLKRMRTIGQGSGDPRLKFLPERLANYADTLQSSINEIRTIFPDLPAETAGIVKQTKERLMANTDDLQLVNNKRVSGFWNSVQKAAEKASSDGRPSVYYRVGHGLSDFLTGQLPFAKIQLIRLGMETLQRALGKSNAKTTAEILQKRGMLLQQINKVNNAWKTKISDTASSIVKPINQKSVLGGAAGALPNLLQMKLDKNHHKEVDRKYDAIIKNINAVAINGNLTSNDLDEKLQSLGVVDPTLQQTIVQNMQKRVMTIAHNLPKETSAMQGDYGLTTAEKAMFLDQVDAICNPEKTMESIANRTISPDCLALFQTYYPKLFNMMKQETLQKMLSEPKIGHIERANIYSLFGFETSINTMKQNILKQAIQSQQPQQPQNNRQQQNNGYRGAGVDKWQNPYQTPSRGIKP